MQKQFKMNHFLSGKWYVRIALLYFLIAAAIPALRASTGLLIQQTGQIVGRVTDAQGVPLSGASIRIAGQQRSVATGDDGRFSLAVAAGDYRSEEGRVGKECVRTCRSRV